MSTTRARSAREKLLEFDFFAADEEEMSEFLPVSLGSATAVVVTHGAVSSGLHLGKPLPFSTYQGFFQKTLLGTWRLWNQAHGWVGPNSDFSTLAHSHVADFGRFYAHAVIFLCPLLGFFAFSLATRLPVTRQWWKPLAIAIALTTPLQYAIHDPLRSAGLSEPIAEAARAAIVFGLMVWSFRDERFALSSARSAHSAL
jgi:hypothetical protein